MPNYANNNGERHAHSQRPLTRIDEQLLRACSLHESLTAREIFARAGVRDTSYHRRRLSELVRRGKLIRMPYRQGYRLCRGVI